MNYHWSAADKVDGGWTAPEDQGWSECTHSLQHCKNGEGEQEQHQTCEIDGAAKPEDVFTTWA